MSVDNTKAIDRLNAIINNPKSSQKYSQISSYTYKISGPWQDPIVQQVKIYRKKR